jgi:hypothetical protein
MIRQTDDLKGIKLITGSNPKILCASMGKTIPHWHIGEVHREFIIEAKAISFDFYGILGSIAALLFE